MQGANVKTLKEIALAWVVTIVVSMSVFPQRKVDKTAIFDSCETSKGKLAVVLRKINEDSDKDSNLILIAGSPSGWHKKYDHKRLAFAIRYMSDRSQISSDRLVWGIGGNSDEFSYLRFFVQGKLVEEIRSHPKGQFCSEDT